VEAEIAELTDKEPAQTATQTTEAAQTTAAADRDGHAHTAAETGDTVEEVRS
jgi:hypothetical protein